MLLWRVTCVRSVEVRLANLSGYPQSRQIQSCIMLGYWHVRAPILAHSRPGRDCLVDVHNGATVGRQGLACLALPTSGENWEFSRPNAAAAPTAATPTHSPVLVYTLTLTKTTRSPGNLSQPIAMGQSKWSGCESGLPQVPNNELPYLCHQRASPNVFFIDVIRAPSSSFSIEHDATTCLTWKDGGDPCTYNYSRFSFFSQKKKSLRWLSVQSFTSWDQRAIA